MEQLIRILKQWLDRTEIAYATVTVDYGDAWLKHRGSGR